ncbi:MAG: helix-turn-helix domain-containing protein [Pseudomonadota bacterium]
MDDALTADEWLARIGESIRALRLALDGGTSIEVLAQQASVSTSALKNLESGRGATLTTLVRVLRALGREGWINTLKPSPVINPLLVSASGSQRQRAPKKRKLTSDGHA